MGRLEIVCQLQEQGLKGDKNKNRVVCFCFVCSSVVVRVEPYKWLDVVAVAAAAVKEQKVVAMLPDCVASVCEVLHPACVLLYNYL